MLGDARAAGASGFLGTVSGSFLAFRMLEAFGLWGFQNTSGFRAFPLRIDRTLNPKPLNH